jgi:hypothetical protein
LFQLLDQRRAQPTAVGQLLLGQPRFVPQLRHLGADGQFSGARAVFWIIGTVCGPGTCRAHGLPVVPAERHATASTEARDNRSHRDHRAGGKAALAGSDMLLVSRLAAITT